jgi:hypothetical protein
MSLKSMGVAEDNHQLPVLDFYFLTEYIESKTGNKPLGHLHYLDQNRLSQLQGGGAPMALERRDESLDPPPLTFLMVDRCQSFEHPLFVLLNLSTHEALFITVRTNEERNIAQEPWFQVIWKGVSKLFNWSKNLYVNPKILYANWIKVCHLIERQRKFPFMFYRILRSSALVLSLFSSPLSARTGNGRRMALENC